MPQSLSAQPADAQRVRGPALPPPDLFGITPTRPAALGAFDQIVAGTDILRDLYFQLQRRVAGGHLYELQLLCRKHGNEQALAAETLALRGRGQHYAAPVSGQLGTAGGQPARRENLSARIAQLLVAHEALLTAAHHALDSVDRRSDNGNTTLVVNAIVRTNEFQVWCLSQQLASLPHLSA